MAVLGSFILNVSPHGAISGCCKTLEPTHQPVIMSRKCLGVSKLSTKSLASIVTSANCARGIQIDDYIDDPSCHLIQSCSLAQSMQHACRLHIVRICIFHLLFHVNTFLVVKMYTHILHFSESISDWWLPWLPSRGSGNEHPPCDLINSTVTCWSLLLLWK